MVLAGSGASGGWSGTNVGPMAVVLDTERPQVASRAPSVNTGDSDGGNGARAPRLLSNRRFQRLWLAQVFSATGDWLGLVAITALAARVGGASQGVAIGLVLSARIVPGFFLGPLAGMFADRWDRRRLMVCCDVGRALVLFSLPFVDTVFGLVVASLCLEAFTMLWSPAKEASVPDIVPESQLTSANSLSLVAAYGTFPLGAGLYALLSKLAGWLEGLAWLERLRLDQAGLAFVVDGLTFLAAAAFIGGITLPSNRRRRSSLSSGVRTGVAEAVRDVREGWEFIFINPVVRSVNLGLATGLIGGGMLVPLGPVFADEVLGAGDAGFGSLIMALGIGMAVGVGAVACLQKFLPKETTFVVAVLAAGGCLGVATTMSTLGPATVAVAGLGVCAGAVYVVGFTLLHERSTAELRGRIFGALFLLVRFCVLLAFLIGPLLAAGLHSLSGQLFDDHQLNVLGNTIAVPGVRLTLWLAAAIILGAGIAARLSIRLSARTGAPAGVPDPGEASLPHSGAGTGTDSEPEVVDLVMAFANRCTDHLEGADAVVIDLRDVPETNATSA